MMGLLRTTTTARSATLPFAILLAGAVLMGASAAGAGSTVDQPVTVTTYQSLGTGSTLSARDEKNNVEHIGCAHTTTPYLQIVGCYARDAQGNEQSCYSTSPIVIKAVESIPSYAFIQFGAEDDGTCRFINVQRGSEFLP